MPRAGVSTVYKDVQEVRGTASGSPSMSRTRHVLKTAQCAACWTPQAPPSPKAHVNQGPCLHTSITALYRDATRTGKIERGSRGGGIPTKPLLARKTQGARGARAVQPQEGSRTAASVAGAQPGAPGAGQGRGQRLWCGERLTGNTRSP